MDPPDLARSFLFEGFRLEGWGLSRLCPDGVAEPVVLGSRALDLLLLLVEHHGKVVAKDTIMQAVWPRTVVEEANLTMQISTLRRILDRRREQGSCIQTLPRRGYRFTAAVTRSDDGTLAVRPTLQPISTPAPPVGPSIAVLPFQNLSGDPEQDYFADGMVEEIITALSRIRWLFVIARNSSFAYKGQAADVEQVGRELGVPYVLEGSVRRAGGRIRIATRLIEAEGALNLWADHFDGPIEDVFELQDRVAISVAGVIESTVHVAEIRRATQHPTTDLTAYDLYLRAFDGCFSFDKERIRSALDLLQTAIGRDPNFGRALALAAVCYHHLNRVDGGGDQDAYRQAGLDYARRAVHASPDDASTLGDAALALGSFGADIATAIELVDRALVLTPSFARGWGISGYLRLWAGYHDAAVEHLETACRLSPREPNAKYRMGIGEAQFFQRRFDAAIATLSAALEEIPGHAGMYRYLAACYAHAGRLDEAREILRRLRLVSATVMPHATQWRNPEHREFYLAGLRLAIGEVP
jgi:TolB-like protein